MNRLLLWIIISSFFIGCNNIKDNNTITFIRLYPNVLFDTVGNPNLHIKQYVEYKFAVKDSLFIGKSENHVVNEEVTPQYGLTKFYSCKIEDNISDLMRTILNENYKKSYLKELGARSIDDRHIGIIVINRNGTQKFILYYEEDRLPDELKQVNDFIENNLIFPDKTTDKPNYSTIAITNLQDYLFQKLAPPPPPLKFIAPIYEE